MLANIATALLPNNATHSSTTPCATIGNSSVCATGVAQLVDASTSKAMLARALYVMIGVTVLIAVYFIVKMTRYDIAEYTDDDVFI